jgi:2-phospho-L-lactate guanylyltransferase
VLVVPVKRLAAAKSRLGERAGPLRAELALAFAVDTVVAALASPPVAGVTVVTDDPTAAAELAAVGAEVAPDRPDAGLNPALRHGALVAARPGCGVGALSADLPSLRPEELALALGRAASESSAFLRDRAGTGTTLLVATGPGAFRPAFGPDSAGAHVRAGIAEIGPRGLDSVRADVDTGADLDRAVRSGVGARTARVLARMVAAADVRSVGG